LEDAERGKQVDSTRNLENEAELEITNRQIKEAFLSPIGRIMDQGSEKPPGI
jgi:hypothetical protein